MILEDASNQFDLNTVDNKTRDIIHELRKELEEVKKELDNKRNDELEIQPIEDKKITKKMKIILYQNMKVLDN
ncbi:hypothetical protein YYC_05056 [Plasmodium yoelii 17X]|uniref:Fam-b protein n=2 Tax=Plasmodium yoelii TaxID=5861 RepID=A0AAF0AYH8_PLAYO|nr:hypothetical protein YYC_05056 [Plasmodium yoelii 17X]WBY55107.1 fam-b protein [Plasmodium yoelii yoelii]